MNRQARGKSKVSSQQELTSAIKDAEKLHGHLGPFLVIGVRMGKIAQKILDINIRENGKLRAYAKIPVLTPFSCILDGIQATTNCTIGNQRLRIENSKKEMIVCFELDKAISISVNQEAVEKLMNRISKGASNEELAWDIAHMAENQLFTIEKE
jgi:formylmethanofuran dehydrogenase subunit E